MNLQGKVAWITGGARMGAEVARVLSQSGCRLLLTYRRSKAEADATASLARSFGADVLVLRCDISKPKDVGQTVRRAVHHFGALDILVNLSSIYEKGAFSQHLKINAEGAQMLTEAVAGAMRRTGGRIIHIADWTSASGRPRYKEFGGYYVSKAAVQAIVESSALELAPLILVNAIAPGPMIPPPGLSKNEYRDVVNATPLKRWGGADEIAKAVKFLCETDFMTGETIRVDGGRHLS